MLELLRRAYEVLPEVAELELVEAAAGLRPGDARQRAGRRARARVAGLVWATGHWRNGILLAPLTADAVAALLTGEALPDVLAPFAPQRFARRARRMMRST